METLALIALICTVHSHHDTWQPSLIGHCESYVLDSGMTEEDCHLYFTDSGTADIDVLLATHVPMYNLNDALIVSCEEEII